MNLLIPPDSTKVFFTALLIERSILDSIENGNRAIGDRVLKDIANTYSINFDWLISGDGDMIAQPKNNFSQISNDQLSETISDVFASKLMAMYKDGEIYPAEVVDRIKDEYNIQIKELRSTILELQRHIWELENNNKH